jgi:hypothetical protein
MTTTERAVRKASRERLLRDIRLAAFAVQAFRQSRLHEPADQTLAYAHRETSRTRYACLMTAFGQ